MKTALTIAGSDCSGGAGIQADIKTMMANGVYAMSAVTAVTAQNTVSVTAVMKMPPEILKQQLECVCSDIKPEAVKIGMMPDAELAKVTADVLKLYKIQFIVYDPVMISSTGKSLMEEECRHIISEQLLPIVSLVTPNIAELEFLSGITVNNKEQMLQAAKIISEKSRCAVLCKGGHLQDESNDCHEAADLLYEKDGSISWHRQQWIDNSNTHGTGCTLSAAITANLAKGQSLPEAVAKAKQYISGCIGAGLNLGAGHGPMNHGFDLQSRFIR